MSWPGVKGAKNFDDHLLNKDFKSDGADRVVWDDKKLFYFCRSNEESIPSFVVYLNLDRESCDCSEPLSGRPESYEVLTARQRHCYLCWLRAEYRFNPLPEEQYLLIHLAGLENRAVSEEASREDLALIFEFLCHCHYACLNFPDSTGRFRVSSFPLLIELAFQLRKPIDGKFAFVLCCELLNLHKVKKLGGINSLKSEFIYDWKRFAASRNCRDSRATNQIPFILGGAQTSDEWRETLKESTLHPLLRELKSNHKGRSEALKVETLKTEAVKVELPTTPSKKPPKKRGKRIPQKGKIAKAHSSKPLQIGTLGLLMQQAAKESDSSLSQMVQESRKRIE